MFSKSKIIMSLVKNVTEDIVFFSQRKIRHRCHKCLTTWTMSISYVGDKLIGLTS